MSERCNHIWSEWFYSPKDWDYIEWPALSADALPFRKDCICGCGTFALRWGYDEQGSQYVKGVATRE